MLGIAFLLGYLLRHFLDYMNSATPAVTALGVFGKEYAEDNLRIVEGIGPKIESLLNADGINTWSELATSSTDRLQGILNRAGDRFKMHNPRTWAEQAGLARDGKWQELKDMQDHLMGGL